MDGRRRGFLGFGAAIVRRPAGVWEFVGMAIDCITNACMGGGFL